MLLKVGDSELEIVKGKFVCLVRDNGETSYFGEWTNLDPGLQLKFEELRDQLMEVMEKFINSKDNVDFEAISEEYKEPVPNYCCLKMPL